MDLLPFPRRLSFPEPGAQILWAKGDAVLGRFDATSWATKEYVVEDAMGFPNEINPDHRQLVICDSEQLAATSIITLWGGESGILLSGTYNTNVLAWAPNGYAQKGESLILNQETPKWIAKKKLIAGCYYLRSGHNFSADWMSRSDLDQIIERPQRMGFCLSRFRARWNEFIAVWKQNRSDNWTPGPIIMGRKIPRFPGKCVEWNSAGGGFTKDAADMGGTSGLSISSAHFSRRMDE